jgi:thiamine biosynthesis protein ThiI
MPRPSTDVVVVHYNEITLKLGHRPMFVNRLVQNMREALADLSLAGVEAAASRVFVWPGMANQDEIVRRLVLVPGIANVRRARALEADLDALDRAVEDALETWRPKGSFRVEARRADKTFASTSPEIAARVGALIARATGAPVDLKAADTTVYVHVVAGRIYLATEKTEGCGGLPVSTGGRVLLLLSGGIDSPVAGLRMMRRGCRVDAVHFHSAPYLSRASQEKAEDLAAVLACGQGTTRLSVVAFGDVQSEIVRTAPRPLRVVLYRRMMMRIASRIAWLDGATALVTGESLGQVASQTLANLSVIEEAASLPVLRPLVGMDKDEITRYARAAGTYEVSILPDQDCCTLFVPKHPSTRTGKREVEEAESALDVDALVGGAVAARERMRIAPHRGAASLGRAAGP